MAIKTFTTGEVLTAADTNTYLANSGMVFVKSQAVGSGVLTIPVTDAFSSTYDNYRIIYTGGVASTATAVSLILGASGISYYGALVRADNAGNTANLFMNDSNRFVYAGVGTTDTVSLDVELFQPNLAKFTLAKFAWYDPRTDNAWGQGTGVHRVATAHTGFTIGNSGGTFTGGTVTVYGYRKA